MWRGEIELNELIIAEFKQVLEETFKIHHGIYTNRNTSLLETINKISAEKGSIEHGVDRETIAAHIYHLKFYIVVVQEYILKN